MPKDDHDHLSGTVSVAGHLTSIARERPDDLQLNRYFTAFYVGAQKLNPVGRPKKSVEEQSWFIVGKDAFERGVKAAAMDHHKSEETTKKYKTMYVAWLDKNST